MARWDVNGQQGLGVRRIAALTGLLVGLAATASLLAGVHERVRDARTRAHVARAQTLAAAGDLAGAIAAYRAALSLERGDDDASRALALTLADAGRTEEAGAYLRDLLERHPTDGPLNRALARVEAAHGRTEAARLAYQRAIYGEWPDGQSRERTVTRLELVRLLEQTATAEELLPELLRVAAELPASDAAAARQVAARLVEHGAADRGAALLAAAAEAAPRDVALLVQLADALTAAGRAADARAPLRRAAALDPSRRDLRQRAETVDTILSLDPTLPGLGLVARTRRARAVLSAVLDETAACEPTPDVAPLRQEAARRVRQRARADAEAAEVDLEAAAQLWRAASGCRGDGPRAQAIIRVLERVASWDAAA